ncbi:MAG: bifunctional adenosylcobinamide kinase/adenosylcobinamide-phosphate guanylyltransferase [Candidatus Omnitrophota bacterium]
MSEIILLTGGVRSGKSRYAQSIAANTGNKVFYIATAEALDPEMRKRIKTHRRSRPRNWSVVEEPLSVSKAVKRLPQGRKTVIIDCITMLISNLIREGLGDPAICSEIRRIMSLLRGNSAFSVIVTNEVGLGIVPDNPLGRRFRDTQGIVNSIIAKEADKVCLLVSGIPLYIK